jgi:hypothetical protein
MIECVRRRSSVNQGNAYREVAARLERFRACGYDALMPLVDGPTISETVRVAGEDVLVEVAVRWEDEKRRTLCVRATAYGPSTWETQRLEERIVVRPGDRA